jgi:hypothetical protein
MALGIARAAMKDEDQIRRFMEEVLRLKYFNGEDWKVTSPEVIEDIWSKLIEFSGESDPLKAIKNEQNSRALAIYPVAKEFVLKSEDPFLAALKLAIAANSMDAMTDVKGEAPEKIIKKWRGSKIGNGNLNCLKERLSKTRKLVYLGDNCGEIVFDKLLIEILLQMYRLEITFIARTLPILNDAILRDALSIGMGEIARLVENGLPGPFPGTSLKRINSKSKRLIEGADLVISKGGGNHDSLTEEGSLKGKVSFLFLSKCYPYSKIHRVPLRGPVIHNF